MAEVFGVVSGAVGVIGVAGQVAKGCIDLHEIISDIQDAPKDMADLAKELALFSDVVRAIEDSPDESDLEDSDTLCSGSSSRSKEANAALEKTIEDCRERMEKVLKLVRRNDVGQHKKKYKRVWTQVRSVLTKSDMDKLVRRLDRARTMLLQAYSHKIGQTQLARLGDLDSSIENLRNEHQFGRSVTFRKFEETYNKIELLRSDISDMRSSTEALMASPQGKQMTDLTQMVAAAIAAATTILAKQAEDSKHTTLSEVESVHSDLHNVKGMLDGVVASINSQQTAAFPGPSQDTTAARPAPTPKPPRHDTRGLLQSTWRQSVSKSEQFLIQNPIFGAVTVQETTVTYGRQLTEEDYNYRRPNKKQGITTKISYIPPIWLSSLGVTFCKEGNVFFTGSEQRFGSPTWGLHTINVREAESEIFIACMDHDLKTVRRLFDDGFASPYDVDDRGRNCLYFLSAYEPVWFTDGPVSAFHAKLETASTIMDLLLSMGLDTGIGSQDDEGRVPVMRFIDTYCTKRFLKDKPNEHPLALFKKLWDSSKTNPLGGHDTLLTFAANGPYCSIEFTAQPDRNYCGFPASVGLWMISQEDWDIEWHPDQLAEVCSPRSEWWSNQYFEMHYSVKNWVTCSYQQIFEFLTTKLSALKRFMLVDICKNNRYESVVHALQVSMEQGGFIFNALSKKLYINKKRPGELAWIRHRFRKLVLLKAWLGSIFRMLLIYGTMERRGQKASLLDFVCFFDFAQRQNLRVSSAYVEAFADVFLRHQSKPEKEQPGEQSVEESDKKHGKVPKQRRRGMRSFARPTHTPEASDTEDNGGWGTDDGPSDSDGQDTECSSEYGQTFERKVFTGSLAAVSVDNGNRLSDEPRLPRSRRAFFFFPRCSCLRRATPYSGCAIRVLLVPKKVKRNTKIKNEHATLPYKKDKINGSKSKHNTHPRWEPRRMHVCRRKRSNRDKQRSSAKDPARQPPDMYDFDESWETEDEWESGYMLEAAIDVFPLDTTNPQMVGKQHYYGEPDYDSDFWGPLYESVKVSRGWEKCNRCADGSSLF